MPVKVIPHRPPGTVQGTVDQRVKQGSAIAGEHAPWQVAVW